ncbi:ferric-chelate reductase 1-like, partial [Plakobranchus ocellatus]
MARMDLILLSSGIYMICFIGGVSCYSRGAPFSTCLTRYPKHSHTMTQSTDSPFTISFNPSSYKPNEIITVTISDQIEGKPFLGFQTAGFRESDNPLEIVGQFEKFPKEKAKIFTCFGGLKNMVTHQNNEPVTNATFEWRAPPYNAGEIKFKATVVEDYTIFWTDVEANLPISGTVTDDVKAPRYEVVASSPVVDSTDFSDCGETKACFLYPRHCQDNDCVAAVSFQYRDDTDDFVVEMYANADSNPGYVGVGFSRDKNMGDDETFICAAFGPEMSVQHGYNPLKYNERLITRFVSSAEVKHEDGHIQCRFVMQPESNVTRVNQKATESRDSPVLTNILFDKGDAWYIQLAWGDVMADSNVITIHKEMPATTSSKAKIKEADIYRGSAFHVLVQVHAAIMILAWTFLSGIVTVIARHYKDMMPRTRILGTKVWFQLHRALAILVAVMTGIGLAVIFSHYGAKIRK